MIFYTNCVIVSVLFNITFNGTTEEYPNYMGFMAINFDDGENLTRLVDFKEQNNGIFLDNQTHLYKSFGTYHPRISLFNNISVEEMDLEFDVEQCVQNFRVVFDNER